MDSSPEAHALAILKNVWGYDAFRGQQLQIVAHVGAGGNAFVLMPTGGGKSLCYQVPGLMREGLCVVISPLIALMLDQVEALQARGIAAALLNSTLSDSDAATIEQQARDGTLKFLYLAPERLLTLKTIALLRECHIGLFAVDEAHCISQWGHDFRPEYRRLMLIREQWPEVPRIALTASADAPSRADIVRTLDLAEARLFLGSFDRTNIFYKVVPKHDAERQLLDYVAEHAHECGVVYAVSRAKVEALATLLRRHGYNASIYHAGLSDADRSKNQREFLASKRMVMCATIAFGMGIDKPDVRFVAHVDLPRSMEGYYQETGRGGRDGERAVAWLCYSPGDRYRLRKMILASDSSPPRQRMELFKLDALLGYCESAVCRHQTLVGWFDEAHPGSCGMCDNCVPERTSNLPMNTVPNGHRAAQMALSAAWRLRNAECTHQALLDTLMGRVTDPVWCRDADSLAVFGKGQRMGLRGWQGVLRQLYGLGYLQLDPHQVSALRVSDKAMRALQQREILPITLPAPWAAEPENLPMPDNPSHQTPAERTRTAPRGPYQPVDLTGLSPAATARWHRLRKWRTDIAKSMQLPAYIVLHDRTLLAIAEHDPADLESLALIGGFGPVKLEKYGATVLELLEELRDTVH